MSKAIITTDPAQYGDNDNTLLLKIATKLDEGITVTATAESTAEATAAAPAYTEGQDAPLSQDCSGNLRVIPSNAATAATAAAQAAEAVLIGPVTETAPATDTASSGLNGRLQRIAQGITSLLAATFTVSGTIVLAAGTALAGKFGIDQTTPGTTNGVVNTGNTKGTASTYSPTLFQNLGANATLNVKASAGNVFSLTCYNANASARYIQLHNTATVPTTTVTVPIFSFLVPTVSQIVIGSDFFTDDGCNFATGIAFAFSTTRDVYTAGSAGDQSTFVQYK